MQTEPIQRGDVRSLHEIYVWIKQEFNITDQGPAAHRPVDAHCLGFLGYILITGKRNVDLTCMRNQLRDKLSPALVVNLDGDCIVIKRPEGGCCGN